MNACYIPVRGFIIIYNEMLGQSGKAHKNIYHINLSMGVQGNINGNYTANSINGILSSYNSIRLDLSKPQDLKEVYDICGTQGHVSYLSANRVLIFFTFVVTFLAGIPGQGSSSVQLNNYGFVRCLPQAFL